MTLPPAQDVASLYNLAQFSHFPLPSKRSDSHHSSSALSPSMTSRNAASKADGVNVALTALDGDGRDAEATVSRTAGESGDLVLESMRWWNVGIRESFHRRSTHETYRACRAVWREVLILVRD